MSDTDAPKSIEAEPSAVEVADAGEGATPPRASRGLAGWKIGLVVGGLGAIVAFLLLGSGAQDAFVYSKLVDEVVTHPAQWRDRELRVEGLLTQGSIRFRESPCEWRFTIEKNGQEMPVRYPQCIVPDTFRDGVNLTVTVQGKLQADSSFVASQVVPRCPSKYEMQQRQRNGEEMPHPMAGRGTIEAAAPTGAAIAPTGAASAPTGAASAPNGAAAAPSGAATAPSAPASL